MPLKLVSRMNEFEDNDGPNNCSIRFASAISNTGISFNQDNMDDSEMDGVLDCEVGGDGDGVVVEHKVDGGNEEGEHQERRSSHVSGDNSSPVTSVVNYIGTLSGGNGNNGNNGNGGGGDVQRPVLVGRRRSDGSYPPILMRGMSKLKFSEKNNRCGSVPGVVLVSKDGTQPSQRRLSFTDISITSKSSKVPKKNKNIGGRLSSSRMSEENVLVWFKCFGLLLMISCVAVVCFITGRASMLEKYTDLVEESNHRVVDALSSAKCGDSGGEIIPDDIMSFKNVSSVEHVINGAISSDDSRCSKIGTSILRDYSGNAVDAAIATMFCLGVVNPASSGIGGGAFMLVHVDSDLIKSRKRTGKKRDMKGDVDGEGEAGAFSPPPPAFYDFRSVPEDDDNDSQGKSKKTEVITCREVAPRASTYNMFQTKETTEEEAEDDDAAYDHSLYGGRAIAVPGELRGLELAHSRYGSVPWSDLVKPSVELASDGFLVSRTLGEIIHSQWNFTVAEKNKFQELRSMISLDNDGITMLKSGDVMRRPAYAATLRRIMNEGADVLYSGDLAYNLTKDIQAASPHGLLNYRDLKDYKPSLNDPLIGRDIGGYNIVGVPPPSSGGAMIIGAARFLLGYALEHSSLKDTLSKHRLVEGMKHVFAMRMSMGDDAAAKKKLTDDVVKDFMFGVYMDILRTSTRDDDVLPLSKYGGRTWSLLDNPPKTQDSKDITKQEKEKDEKKNTHHSSKSEKADQTINNLRNKTFTEVSTMPKAQLTKISTPKKLTNDNTKTTQKEVTNENDAADDENQRKMINKSLTELKRQQQKEEEEIENEHNTEDYGGGGTHVSVVDKDRNAVSITSSLNTHFGSMVLSPSTGIVLNNQMNDFATPAKPDHYGLAPSEFNSIQSRKRPLSSMSPTMIFLHNEGETTNKNDEGGDDDLGKLLLVLGASGGGPTIISSVLQVFINHSIMGMTLYESIAQPRLHHQYIENKKSITRVENVSLLHGSDEGYPILEVANRTKSALLKRHHELEHGQKMGFVNAVGVDYETDEMTAVVDVRVGAVGGAVGY